MVVKTLESLMKEEGEDQQFLDVSHQTEKNIKHTNTETNQSHRLDKV